MNGFLDNGADAVRRQYASLQMALIGLYAQAINGSGPTAPATRAAFSTAAYQNQVSFLTAVNSMLAVSTDVIVKDALKASGLGAEGEHYEMLRQIVSESCLTLMGTLSMAVHRDAEQVAKMLRDFALNVDHKMNAGGLSYTAAVIKTRIEQPGVFNFKQVDRANRSWNSVDYARTAVRGYLVSVWIESFLFGVSRMGEDLARVVSDNEHNGVVFSISGMTPGYPTFEEIKGSVWHPNSRAKAERITA